MSLNQPDKNINLSVVTPVFNNQDTLQALNERVTAVCRSAGLRHELILVDDGSPDDSWSFIKTLAEDFGHVRGIRLGRNMGQHFAAMAGFSFARGDIVGSMDADLQDPPEHLPDLIRAMAPDIEVVFGGRSGKYQGYVRMLTSWTYRCTLPFLTGLPADAGMFMVIRRHAIKKMMRFVTGTPSILAMIGAARLNCVSIPVQRDFRLEGRSAYSGWGRLKAYIIFLKCVRDLKLQRADDATFQYLIKSNLAEITP